MIKKFSVEIDGGEEYVVPRSVLQKWFIQCDDSWFTKFDEEGMAKYGERVFPYVAGITSVSAADDKDDVDILDVNVTWPLGHPAACNGDPHRMPSIQIIWNSKHECN